MKLRLSGAESECTAAVDAVIERGALAARLSGIDAASMVRTAGKALTCTWSGAVDLDALSVASLNLAGDLS